MYLLTRHRLSCYIIFQTQIETALLIPKLTTFKLCKRKEIVISRYIKIFALTSGTYAYEEWIGLIIFVNLRP